VFITLSWAVQTIIAVIIMITVPAGGIAALLLSTTEIGQLQLLHTQHNLHSYRLSLTQTVPDRVKLPQTLRD
jgi:uncharacterized membrane protein YccF (DUF307 family)